MVKRTCFLYLLLSLFTSSALLAQRVGLVLSGGGAKGLAHVGVIRALEEQQIPIDYISGTSIGAIVGGLYAAGYSPDEMEDIFKSDDFLRVTLGEDEAEDRYFFTRRMPNASMIDVRFAVDSAWQLAVPDNLVPTYKMNLMAMQLYTPAAAVAKNNFDSLFVPFRCVASDVYNKEAVVIQQGNLSNAIRASMAYPLYFDPVRINGRLLFDGGILDNFPKNTMITDFQPDIIIGVRVASGCSEPQDNDFVSQLESMIMLPCDFSLPDSNGIMIEPDVSSISLMDFSQAEAMFDTGYYAAMRQMDAIKTKIERQVDTDSLQQARASFKKQYIPLIFEHIKISGVNKKQEQYLLKSIRQKQQHFSYQQFEKVYFRLSSEEFIESIYPTATYNPQTGNYNLELMIAKSKPFKAMAGGNLSTNSISQAFVGAEYRQFAGRVYRYSGNFYFGRFYSSAQVKTRIDFPTRLPFYNATSLTFNRWDFYRSNGDLFFKDIKPAYLIQNEVNLRTDVSLPLGHYARLTGGAAIALMSDDYYQTSDFVESDTADCTEFRLWTSHLSLEHNTLNLRQYPNDGARLAFRFRYINGHETHKPGSRSDFNDNSQNWHQQLRAQILYDNYIHFSRRFTMGFYAELHYADQTFFNNYTSTMLATPAFSPTPHSKTLYLEAFRADVYAATGLKTILHLGHLDFRIEGYFFQPYKTILQNTDLRPVYGKKFPEYHYIGAMTLVYHTLIGPAALSINYYDQTNSQNHWHLLFTFGYTLFNRRGID